MKKTIKGQSVNSRTRTRTQAPVVIITGATSGIGRAAAEEFLRNGWIVVGTTRQSKPPELPVASVDWQTAELTNPESLTALVQRTAETYGHIDALVSNAGYGLTGPVEELNFELVERQMQVNVSGAIHLIARALSVMKRQGYGRIVITSSIAGRVGIPGFAAYSASKFALEGFAETMWHELPDSIKVKLIEPSVVNTSFWSNLQQSGFVRRPNPVTKAVQHIVTGSSRGLTPEAVAKAIYRATVSRSRRLRYPLGVTSPVVAIKRWTPEILFRYFARRFY